MDEKDYYTTELQERIYHGSQADDRKEISRQLNLFLSDLIKRKRNDPYEEGLQAAMIILPNSFGAKVTENDGKSVHGVTFINLAQHLNGNRKYLTDEGFKRTYLYRDESFQIIREGIEIRVLDGEDQLMLAITSTNDNQTDFQLDILKKIIFYCKQIKERGFYPSVEVGFHTPSMKVEFAECDENFYQEILQEINKKGKK